MSTENLSTYEEQGENPEHVQAMIEKGEQIEANNNPDAEERPEWLPDKFTDAQQMAEAYAQLEQKMGSGTNEENVETGEAQEAPSPSAKAAEVVEVLDNVGIDFDTLQGEYNELGGLSEEAYGALAEKGFSKDLVDTWIKGQEAVNTEYQTAVYDAVGGEESYKEMISWAADSLSKQEIAAYDRAVDSGDIDMVKLAVSGLTQKYQSVEGSDPSLIGGQSTSSTGGTYESWAQVTSDMRDPRYESDPSYRQTVANKLARSNVS
tara:strand:+ start:3412 stop:4200 length:789 start_codon:yes stop_codon:yes gene_type:complete